MDGVRLFAAFAVADNSLFTLRQIGVLANLHVKGGGLSPGVVLRRLSLRVDSRVSCRVRGLLRADDDDAWGCRLGDLQLAVFHHARAVLARLLLTLLACGEGVVELNDRRKRQAYRRRRARLLRLLRADAHDAVLRLHQHGRGGGRLARGLAVLVLLGGHGLLLARSTRLFDNHLPGLQRRVLNDLRVKRQALDGHDRLLGLLRLARLSRLSRGVTLSADLHDLVDRLLGHLGRFLRCVHAVLELEVDGVGLLTAFAVADNSLLALRQIGVLANLHVKGGGLSPGIVLRRLSFRVGSRVSSRVRGLLRADDDDARRRLLGDLQLAVFHHALAVLAGLLLLLLASREGVIELDLRGEGHAYRRQRGRLLRADADDLRLRLLRALGADDWVAGGLAVDKLLRRRLGLLAEHAGLFNFGLAGIEVRVGLDLGVERQLLGGLGHQLGLAKLGAVLHDPLHWVRPLRRLHVAGMVALSVKRGGVGFLAVCAFLDDLGLARLQVGVRAHRCRERQRNGPGHLVGGLSLLGAHKHDLVRRLLSPRPGSVLVLLLRASGAFLLHLVLARGERVVVLVLDLEWHLSGRLVHHGDRCGDPVHGAVGVLHGDRDVNRIARLRGCRGLCEDGAVLVQADQPVAVGGLDLVHRIAKLVDVAGVGVVLRGADLVRILRRDLDAVRVVQRQRQRGLGARVHALGRVGRLDLEVLGQADNGGHGRLIGRAVRVGHRCVLRLLVARLRIGRRGDGDVTGLRVDGVLPAVLLGLGDRCVAVHAEGEGAAFRQVLRRDAAGDFLARRGRLRGVARLVQFGLLIAHDERGVDDVLAPVVVRHGHRHIDVVAGAGSLRSRRVDSAVVVDRERPPVDFRGDRVAVIHIIGEVAPRDIRGRRRLRRLRAARRRPRLQVVRVVDLAGLGINDKCTAGHVGGAVVVVHAHGHLRGRSRLRVRTDLHGDLARIGINRQVVPGQVARQRDVGRIVGIRDELVLRLVRRVHVRGVDRALHLVAGLAVHGLVVRVVRARCGGHHAELGRNRGARAVRVGHGHWEVCGCAIRQGRIRGRGDRAVVINSKRPTLRAILRIRKLVRSTLGVLQLRGDVRGNGNARLSLARRVAGHVCSLLVTNDVDGASGDLRSRATGIVRLDRERQACPRERVGRDLRGDLARLRVNRQEPLALLQGRPAVREGVTRRGLITLLATDANVGNGRGQRDLILRLAGDGLVVRNLHARGDLKVDVRLVRRPVRVGRKHLDVCVRVVRGIAWRRRRDGPVPVDLHVPALRNGGRVDFEFRRLHGIVAAHGWLVAHL